MCAEESEKVSTYVPKDVENPTEEPRSAESNPPLEVWISLFLSCLLLHLGEFGYFMLNIWIFNFGI